MKFDLIYYDAFSPNAQPELWTETIFKKMYDLVYPRVALLVRHTVLKVRSSEILKQRWFHSRVASWTSMRKREMTSS
jgi:tRNA U34 5-methylaminomethyl-2-thiouridine-forming methyltransferase MnmC